MPTPSSTARSQPQLLDSPFKTEGLLTVAMRSYHHTANSFFRPLDIELEITAYYVEIGAGMELLRDGWENRALLLIDEERAYSFSDVWKEGKRVARCTFLTDNAEVVCVDKPRHHEIAKAGVEEVEEVVDFKDLAPPFLVRERCHLRERMPKWKDFGE